MALPVAAATCDVRGNQRLGSFAQQAGPCRRVIRFQPHPRPAVTRVWFLNLPRAGVEAGFGLGRVVGEMVTHLSAGGSLVRNLS